MPSVDLSNVSLTIQQFQDIASGKYNAGEVRLTSDRSLGKINHHVHWRFINTKSLPHAEILAIKDAFVRALSQNGVDADAIARIRRDLGLSPDGTTDTSLALRSIRPLSRQQIRDILDSNAEAINAHAGAGTIRTRDEVRAGGSAERRAGFDRTSRATNAETIRRRAALPDRGIQDVQSLIAGDIHFRPEKERDRLIAVAERQRARILERSNGAPSNDRAATVRLRRDEDGLDMTFRLEEGEADFVKRLDDMIRLLRSARQPSVKTLAVRDAFLRLAGAKERADWVAGLAYDRNGGFKARTVAVGVLLDRGVDDWATLSLVNKLSDRHAIEFASELVARPDDLRGDALRRTPLVAGLAGKAYPIPIPPDRHAFIPALPPRGAGEAPSVG